MYLSKIQNACALIAKCFCPNCKEYLSNLQNFDKKSTLTKICFDKKSQLGEKNPTWEKVQF